MYGLLLAFLFLIDESLEEWGIDRATTAAEDIGLLLYRRMVLHEREHIRDEALLRDLIAADPAVRARAREEIDEEGLPKSVPLQDLGAADDDGVQREEGHHHGRRRREHAEDQHRGTRLRCRPGLLSQPYRRRRRHLPAPWL
ncbi:hypothetical protein ABT063_38615 [Streptomyces sp. NPDC002838]|uniref:hypothetical protein n=1 Tax=Streptomyces sp. NPDC002838 TaxID=3154436 RepID=UPI003326ED15